ncbi:glycerate dehydrogenase [Natranaerovirga hydrolytica]|uniref:Glycerate dehydrogenase n=1 Tax=Natranaerovirga hydrolytica TaxID=680378 RepID=A0A4R1MZI1_9FIRM|nr:D-2-hydroxyacid dehydrogenase [Natranaerovirga hydrolytica]TCK98686.1 glycerate dehydrogenase [Natranaerovirga hydrolytica]
MKIAMLDANTLGEDIDLNVLNECGAVTVHGFTTPDEVVERIKDADIIITNKVILDKKILEQAKNVKLICITATGTNVVDLEYARSRDIDVTNIVGYSTESVAQHTFSLLFYLYEKLSYYDDYVKSRQYVDDKMFTHFDRKFNEIHGKTFGIIGLGTIGKRVAAIAEAFGCKVIYYSTSGKNNDSTYQQCSLDELLEQSDVISIHAPLTPATDNLITYKELSKMKQTAIILNLGRGRIINEGDLAKALNEGLIEAAALDVLENEPIKGDNPLLEIQDSTRLLITPHIAWATIEARNRMLGEVKMNIEAFLKNEKRNIVN